MVHLNIPVRGERHLFQTPSPIEKKIIPPTTTTTIYFNKYPTITRKKIIIEIISFIETPNPNLNEIKSLALMIYQYTACKSLP
jgi:hypothetical protein